MNIGIIGSGNMGRAIGVRLAALGHQIALGARRRQQAEVALRLAGQTASAGSNDEAARWGDVLVWTMREPDPTKVLNDPSVLEGKIIIDLNNRDYDEVKTGRWFDQAIAERLQVNAPGAEVVKAFNTIPMEGFDRDPAELIQAGAVTFLAGGSPSARKTVGELARSLGFRPVDLGESEVAMRAVEALGDAIRMILIDGNEDGIAHLSVTRLPDSKLDAVGDREQSAYG